MLGGVCYSGPECHHYPRCSSIVTGITTKMTLVLPQPLWNPAIRPGVDFCSSISDTMRARVTLHSRSPSREIGQSPAKFNSDITSFMTTYQNWFKREPHIISTGSSSSFRSHELDLRHPKTLRKTQRPTPKYRWHFAISSWTEYAMPWTSAGHSFQWKSGFLTCERLVPCWALCMVVCSCLVQIHIACSHMCLLMFRSYSSGFMANCRVQFSEDIIQYIL